MAQVLTTGICCCLGTVFAAMGGRDEVSTGPASPTEDPVATTWSRRRLLLAGAGTAGAVVGLPALTTACSRESAMAATPAAAEAPTVGEAARRSPSASPAHFAQRSDRPDLRVGPGAWCWFQEPRASIAADGTLWLGTTVDHTDTPRDGDVELTGVDLAAMKVTERRKLGHSRPDDHISPSVLAVGGAVQVAWSYHKRNDFLETTQHRPGGGLASTIQQIHRPAALVKPGRGMAYASAHIVGGQRWLLYRGEFFSWNLLTSPNGERWTYRGLVIAPNPPGQRPYLQAASDGAQLHITVTDGNPAEFRGNSVYAGSIAADLTVHYGQGRQVGQVGASPPVPSALTRIVAGRRGTDEAHDTDAWLVDLKVIDGAPTAILSIRDPWPDDSTPVPGLRHRYQWARRDRFGGWKAQDLAQAGGGISEVSKDYAGLAALHPNDPDLVVVSTNVHPATGAPVRSARDKKIHFELFEGRRSPGGGWAWTAITVNSTRDNLRPVIAVDPKHGRDVLAWMWGQYYSWTDIKTSIIVRSVVRQSN